MAHDTPLEMRSLVIYQVFPRNHGPSGTLVDVTADVERIAALGVDVLYLMPIHPIGEAGRKGSMGSPYAVADYRSVNPELGTDADFDDLVAAAHGAGLQVMIDVVFNHTSPDSVLLREHPEFFHQDAQGRPVTSVPAWTDIIDLAHPNPALSRYLIDTLALWVRRGVDGFRCDVASLVPVEFWLQARSELAQIRPGLIWLAESPHPLWIGQRRAQGLSAWSDAEMYAAFDIEYSYDLWSIWQSVVLGDEPVGRYLEMLRWQDASLPANYAKLRFVENHDQFRIMSLAPTRDRALAWTALMAFSRGPLMFYAGQESAAEVWPSLFDPAPVAWGDRGLSDLLRALAVLKKHAALRGGGFWVLDDEPFVQAAWASPVGDRLAPVTTAGDDRGVGLYGVFDVGGHEGSAQVQLPDGSYRDLISGEFLNISRGALTMPGPAVVLEFGEPFAASLWHSTLLDVFRHVEVEEA